ncbi:MAG TPA: dipeptidase, partial [Bryobacteraceae bacterium]|nr:dipeptidase [Bryobacteraceae bacterium]
MSIPARAQDDMARARRISAEAIGIDSHIDTAQRVLIGHVDITQRTREGHVDLPRLREGGMHAPFFALWVPVYYQGAEAVRRTLDLRDAMQQLFDSHPDQIEMAVNASDIERIVKAHKIAAFLTLEGGHQIDDDLGVLRMYRRMGIRAMTLTHFRNNNWADSSTDKPAHNGLTDFGKQVVREMNRLGIIVDVSHVSDKTFYDAIAVSSQPVILSHSSCRALSNVPRNVTDDMLRALAKNGGVIGINFGEGFISQKDVAALKAAIASNQSAPPDMTGKLLDDYANKEYRKDLADMKTGLATLSEVADHVDHIVKVAGIDHVG